LVGPAIGCTKIEKLAEVIFFIQIIDVEDIHDEAWRMQI